jgi:LuxR family maltose regulon positive regulatory protein
VLRSVLTFKLGRIGEAERVAHEALAVASSDSPLGLTVANCILGIARYYDGALDAAADALDEAVRLATAGDNGLARIYALGYLGLVRVEQGDADAARASVAQALELAAEPSAAAHFVTAMALLAHGRLEGDGAALEEAVTLARRGAAPVEIAAALVGLGEHRRDPATLAEARGTLATCPDPGRLPNLIETAELGLRGRRPGQRRQIAGDLSDRELAVLRLFPTDASLREIAGKLYVSLNTVKTHSKSIYRKLGVSTRAEAVERAGELDLL